jgi:hypothetical protein
MKSVHGHHQSQENSGDGQAVFESVAGFVFSKSPGECEQSFLRVLLEQDPSAGAVRAALGSREDRSVREGHPPPRQNPQRAQRPFRSRKPSRHQPVELSQCRGTAAARSAPQKDPEKRREFMRKWRAANREKLRAASRKWRNAISKSAASRSVPTGKLIGRKFARGSASMTPRSEHGQKEAATRGTPAPRRQSESR